MAGPGGVLVGRGYVVIRPEFQGDWDRRVHAQTSRSGTSGGRAFGASFAKAAGAGLSGLSTVLKSSLAGSALAATAVGLGNIGSAALAASAVAVPALSAIGTAGAAIGIGFKGIGKAFKAFDSAAQDATAAASATRAVESAQRALGKAQQSVAEARVASARRVQDAERAVVDAQRDATRAHEDSTDAQRVAIDVQNELTAARRDATRQLEDYRLRIADAAIDQEEAAQRVRDAEQDLADARKTTDKDAIARAELAVRRAKLGVEQQAQDFKRLREEEAAATKAGVDGSEQVLAARERIANANDRAKDAAERAVEADRNVIEAQRGVAEAHVDGSKQIAAAQESVADAARALADAQQAAASQVSKVDDALAKLTPNARDFVETVKDLGPAWGEVRKATQESLFKGVADSFRAMSTQIIPDLKSGLSGAATQINAMWRNWMDGVARLSREGSLKKFFEGNNRILEDFAKWPAEATRGWVQLSIAATPALERITTAVGDASTRLSERMDKAFESGAMERAITRGLDALVALKPTLSDIGTVFSNVFGAISGPGSQAIGVFGIFLDELVRVTSLPKVKQAITDIFTAFADIAGLFLGALGKVLEYGLPLLATSLTWIADVAPRAVAGLVSFGQAVGEKLGPPLLAAAEGTRDLFAAMASGDSAKASGSASVMERIGAAARGFGDKSASGVRSFFDAFKSGDLAPKWFTASPGLDGVFDRMGVAARAAGDIVRDQLAPALLGLGRGLADFIIPVVQSVGRIYTEHLQHTFERIATVIHRALVPIMEALGKFIEDRLAPALQTLGAKFANLFDRLNPIIGALDSLITFVFKVGATLAGYLAPILINLAGPVFTFLVKAIGFGIDAIALLLQGIGGLGKGAIWLWDNALKPAFTAIGDGVKWLWDKVEPVFGWIKDSIRGWGIVATWLWENAVKPAFDGIAGAATWLWREAIKPSIDSIVDGFQSIGRWAENTYNNVADWFGKIGDKIGDVVGGFVDAFATARDSVGAVWSAVMGKVASPINWIIDKVYGGLRSVWNTVADKVGLGSLKLDAIGQIEAPPAAAPAGRQHAFAAGGIYPGYTPGRDIGMAAVSGGEAIMRPEWTRAVGPGYIHAANRAAVSGGMGGVEKFLGANGVPYAGKFALGGIVDDAVDWAKGLARGAAAKGLELGMKPIRAGINQAPDSPDWWRIGKQIPIRWIDAMIDKVRGEDAKWASSGVLSGLSWAKSQAGKPYQWGGSGDPSFDCSGFMAAISEVIRGRAPRRLWTTFDFNGSQAPEGWKQNADASFRVGVTNAGVGHMAGTLLGTNVESRGGDGIVVGPNARGADHAMFNARYGFLPSLGAGAGAAPTGALASWISQALAATGTPPPGSLGAWMSGMATLVGRESGGNPLAINTTDSNARAGNASRGLAQVVPTTFNAFHQLGTSWDPFDPVANLAASINWIKYKYGSIGNVQQANPLMSPKGYSFGGIVPRGGGTHDDGGWLQHGELGLNMSGAPEAVLTSQEWRDVRGLVANRSALDQAVALLAGRNEAPFIEHYHAARDEDPRRLAEEQRALTRSRGPRS